MGNQRANSRRECRRSGDEKKEQREQWPSMDPPPVVHKRDAPFDDHLSAIPSLCFPGLPANVTFTTFLLQVDNRPTALVVSNPYLSLNTWPYCKSVQNEWSIVLKKRCAELCILRWTDMTIYSSPV
ncbi:hypothetical protein TNCV_4555521 [Trichonephila clavipes]|nr:hypothetical protein TNCV_4555521 [Trichonephila clavipes]